MWFPNRPDTNRPVQLQKQARNLKFWSYVEEELYYPSNENKGADLRLCFRLCRLLVFPWGGSFFFYFESFVGIFIGTICSLIHGVDVNNHHADFK